MPQSRKVHIPAPAGPDALLPLFLGGGPHDHSRRFRRRRRSGLARVASLNWWSPWPSLCPGNGLPRCDRWLWLFGRARPDGALGDRHGLLQLLSDRKSRLLGRDRLQCRLGLPRFRPAPPSSGDYSRASLQRCSTPRSSRRPPQAAGNQADRQPSIGVRRYGTRFGASRRLGFQRPGCTSAVMLLVTVTRPRRSSTGPLLPVGRGGG